MNPSRRDWLKTSAALSVAGLAGSLSLSPTSARAQSGAFHYKAAVNVPMTHPIYLRLQEASNNIRQQTNGQVDIMIFPNGQLGGDTEMLSQVRSGALQFLVLPGVVLANLVPMASLNSVGFAFPDYPSVWRAMDGPLGSYIRTHIGKSGLVVMDKVWDNGFRQMTSNRPIDTAADLNHVKIRVPVSPLLLSLFKSLGAAPTPINFNELYSALQTKIVDAQENPLPIIATGKLFEVQKYCALTAHVWDGYWCLANPKAWDALPPKLREIVAAQFNAGAVAQRSDSEKLALSLRQELTGKGLIFKQPGHPSFRQALAKAGFYDQWKKKFGDEAWNMLEGAVGKLT